MCTFVFLLFILFSNVMSTYNNFLKDLEKVKTESMKLKEVVVRKESSLPAESKRAERVDSGLEERAK
ncbi:hypothetical protein PENTCL1PPCAC_30437, partial [Pristionchus entomophagus]